jgi:hypothetical protein
MDYDVVLMLHNIPGRDNKIVTYEIETVLPFAPFTGLVLGAAPTYVVEKVHWDWSVDNGIFILHCVLEEKPYPGIIEHLEEEGWQLRRRRKA